MKIRTCNAVLKGIATCIPGMYRYYGMKSRGGTISARYCYSVWLRHLVMLHKNGLSTTPDTVAEIGPGDSLGIGLSAVLSGTKRYWAFDVARFAGYDKNIEILNQLIELFKRREKIPDRTEFPEIKPVPDSYKFPSYILTNERLDMALKSDRIEMIKKALMDDSEGDDLAIRYFVPWHDSGIIKYGSVDMIYSQAVLEHVDDLVVTYEVLYRWLRTGGIMSHDIDFRCHGIAEGWNDHWAYSDLIWRLIRGRRPYFLNRHPHSTHIHAMQKCGFKIICDIKSKSDTQIQNKDLAAKFRNMSYDDLTTSTAFIQAVK